MIKIYQSPLIGTLSLSTFLVFVLLLSVRIWPLPNSVDEDASTPSSEGDQRTIVRRQAELNIALARPIFHQNRRPPQAREAEQVQIAEPKRAEAPYLLVGIVGTADDNRSAYILNQETQETVAAIIGQQLGAWKVDTIGTNFVTLTLGEERRVIQLADGN